MSFDHIIWIQFTPVLGIVLAGDVTNIILDPILMFVFHMGVGGAAIAHVISQWVLNCTFFRPFLVLKHSSVCSCEQACSCLSPCRYLITLALLCSLVLKVNIVPPSLKSPKFSRFLGCGKSFLEDAIWCHWLKQFKFCFLVLKLQLDEVCILNPLIK